MSALNLKKVSIVGGGPAGLYGSILLKQRFPAAEISVFDQNPADATFGFGVVFSEQALGFIKQDDAQTYDLINPHMKRWHDMTLNVKGQRIVIDSIGFSAIGRLELVQLMQRRASDLGVALQYQQTVDNLDAIDADLIIGADGVNSLVRRASEGDFQTEISYFDNKFAWFGADREFDTLTQSFVDSEWGPFNAHHYSYAPGRSTFIVECERSTWLAAGLDQLDQEQTRLFCEKLFARVLGQGRLLLNNSVWRNFPKIWNNRWSSDNRVLVGDALHTAHFSIGSGTRLAMEDVIALSLAMGSASSVRDALESYENNRKPIAKKLVDAANRSAQWYETFSQRIKQEPGQFALDYMSRSGRVSPERLRKIAPQFAERYLPNSAAAVSSGAAPQTPSLVVSDPVTANAGSREIGFEREKHSNASAILFDNLDRNPDAVAVVSDAGNVTYKDLCERAAQWGNALLNAGHQRGERVAVLMDDTAEYPALLFGAMRAGLVPVLLNTMSPPDLIAYFMSDMQARVAVCDWAFAERLSAVTAPNDPLERVVLCNLPEGASLAQLGVRNDFVGADDFLDGAQTRLICAATGPLDMACWLYSSGSTGKPKGIVHLHHDMAYTVAAYSNSVLKLQASDRCFSVPKIYFAYGLGNSLVFPFAAGASVVLLSGRSDAKRIFDVVARDRPTVFFGLPTLYTSLANSPAAGLADLSSIRLSISAAETLSEEIATQWHKLTGALPVEGLGSSEMLHIYLSNTVDDYRLGSAGKRLPGYELALRDDDDNLIESVGDGVLWVRGDSSAPFYWNRPENTQQTMRADWVYTGDRFHRDADGFYYFRGRADDMVKVSGQWVYPIEVENVLAEHAQIAQCAVIAFQLPDKRMSLRAYVQLKSGESASPALTEALQTFVKSKLAPYKYPRYVVYLDDMPKTGTDKIDRQALLRRDDGLERRTAQVN